MGSSPSNHDVNAECAERIAIVIQKRIFSNQSPFVVNVETFSGRTSHGTKRRSTS